MILELSVREFPAFEAEKCRGCKVCQIENTCKVKAAKVVDGVLRIDENECNNCVSVLENVRSKRLRTVHTVTESISAEDGARDLHMENRCQLYLQRKNRRLT